MARLRIDKPNYAPHPAGRHQGRIIEVRDLRIVESPFGAKHKVCIIIESSTAQREDGSPAQVQKRMTLSSHPKAPLRLFREAVLDRPLTEIEQEDFDGDRELVDLQISYRIDHTEPDADGRVFGNIRDGSIEPVSNKGDAPAPMAPAQQRSAPARSTTAPDGSQRKTGGAGDYRDQAPLPDEDELPFNSAHR